MVTPLRRGKILDTAICSFLLIIFGIVPVALLLTRNDRRFTDENLQTAYTAVLALSWPFFSLGGIVLLYFWRKDRAVDKTYFSTATTRQLSVIAGALISTVLGCVLLFTGILLNTLNRFQQDHSTLIIVFEIVSMLLILWITYAVVSVIFEVRASKRSVQDFAQNQAFAEAPQYQRSTPQQAPGQGPHQASTDDSEPAFV